MSHDTTMYEPQKMGNELFQLLNTLKPVVNRHIQDDIKLVLQLKYLEMYLTGQDRVP